MKFFAALLMGAFLTAPVASAGTGPSPLEDQRCLNQAYVHMHADHCVNAMFPPDYGSHEWVPPVP